MATHHDLKKRHFKKPTFCHHCNSFIWGLGATGWRCQLCHYSIHTRCLDYATKECVVRDGKKSSRKAAKKEKKEREEKPLSQSQRDTLFHPGLIDEYYKITKKHEDEAESNAITYDGVEIKTQKAVTIKAFSKASVSMESVERQIGIQKKLRHPGIIELVAAFSGTETVYLVTERVNGKEVFDKIEELGRMTEKMCQSLIRQLFEAVAYLHSMDIAHRNLRAENVLVVELPNGRLQVKIVDFGLAASTDVRKLATSCGAPDYVAPEILSGEPYGKEVDIWACGVIAYILLAGYPPFYDESHNGLFKKIMAIEYDFPEEDWDEVSDTAKNFIAHLLVGDPDTRLSAEEALDHPWLAQAVVSNDDELPGKKAYMSDYVKERRAGRAMEYRKPANKDKEKKQRGRDNATASSSGGGGGGGGGSLQDDFTPGKTEDHYEIGKELGRGGCAIVYRCTELRTGEQWALKRLVKAEIDPKRLEREIRIMKGLEHPAILRMKEAFDSEEYIDLIMQLANDGELFDKIISKGHFSEEEAAFTVYQMLEGIKYLHQRAIAHRDLKPENILVHNDVEIKIADFGLSNIESTEKKLTTPCGTPDYVAPEVLHNKGYNLACDIWSAGVIAFIILCGHPPFHDQKRAGLYQKIMNGQYDFRYPEWKYVSDTAKDFVRHLMEINPSKRYTAQQSLDHPWLKDARKRWEQFVAGLPASTAAAPEQKLRPLASVSHLKQFTEQRHAEAQAKKTRHDPNGVGKTPWYTPGKTADSYEIGAELGRGGCGVVYSCVHKKDGTKWALKRIKKKDFELQKLQRELQIMKSLNHGHILRMKEAFDSPEEVDLIMELANGGELFDLIIKKGHFSEAEAAHVIKQLCEGVAYLHEKGIAHRDLKPENVLLVSRDKYDIKIADFGLSNILPVDAAARLATACGTPDYVAPEVLKGEGYNEAVDMWAIGVLTYILLCGYPPFYDKNQAGLFRKIMNCDYRFHDKEWAPVSDSARDFIRNLLVAAPERRSTATEILKHPWLTESHESSKAGTTTATSEKLNAYTHARRKQAPPKPKPRAEPQDKKVSKRDRSYQIVINGAKEAPIALDNGWEFVYRAQWDAKLVEFIGLERRYQQAQNLPGNNFTYEVSWHGDSVRFRVFGEDAKKYVSGVLKGLGKL